MDCSRESTNGGIRENTESKQGLNRVSKISIHTSIMPVRLRGVFQFPLTFHSRFSLVLVCKTEGMKRKHCGAQDGKCREFKWKERAPSCDYSSQGCRAMTTGTASISLTTVCDATLGFAPDILIRAITPGQPDLHGKRPPRSMTGSNIQRWESLLVFKLIVLPELLKSLLVATFWELTTYFYPLQVVLLTDIYRKWGMKTVTTVLIRFNKNHCMIINVKVKWCYVASCPKALNVP